MISANSKRWKRYEKNYHHFEYNCFCWNWTFCETHLPIFISNILLSFSYIFGIFTIIFDKGKTEWHKDEIIYLLCDIFNPVLCLSCQFFRLLFHKIYNTKSFTDWNGSYSNSYHARHTTPICERTKWWHAGKEIGVWRVIFDDAEKCRARGGNGGGFAVNCVTVKPLLPEGLLKL